jgi:hypothetical protein
MRPIVIFLEEPSAQEMLKGVLPRLGVPVDDVHFIVFQGKQDMMKRLERRLRGWLHPSTLFMVMRDQDSGHCERTKQELQQICDQAGRAGVLIRIACHELESFYLGDLSAVEQGLGLQGIARKQNEKRFRTPDSVSNPVQELERVTCYRYQKVSGSRAIGPHLSLTGNRSHSFRTLISGLQKLLELPADNNRYHS